MNLTNIGKLRFSFSNFKESNFLLLVIVIYTTLLFATSKNYPLAETSEARYAEISREMVVTNDFIHPQLLGIFHYHKPPVTYWITAFGYSIFGINEFGARFFLQISVLLQILLVFCVSKLIYNDKKIAILSAVVYATLPIVLISSRNLTTDAFLTTFIISAIFFWLRFVKQRKGYNLYLFYISIGLAMLTKGPVALIFVIVFMLFYYRLKDIRFKFSIHHIFGVLICISISSSWYLFVISENPTLLDYFISDQLVERIIAQSFNRAKPFWFYIPVILGLLAPWVILLVLGRKKLVTQFKINASDKTLLYTTLMIVAVFSLFKTKLLLYILPMFWMVAILIGHQLIKISKATLKTISFVFLGLALIIILIPFVANYFIDAIAYSELILIASLVIGLCVFCLALVLIKKDVYNYFMFSSLTFSSALLIVSQLLLYQNPHLSNSVSNEINSINKLDASNNFNGSILVYNYLLSSVPIYSKLRTVTLHFDHNTTQRETQFQVDSAWKNNHLDLKSKVDRIRLDSIIQKKDVYLLVRKKRRIHNDVAYLKEVFKKVKEYPKWILYFN